MYGLKSSQRSKEKCKHILCYSSDLKDKNSHKHRNFQIYGDPNGSFLLEFLSLFLTCEICISLNVKSLYFLLEFFDPLMNSLFFYLLVLFLARVYTWFVLIASAVCTLLITPSVFIHRLAFLLVFVISSPYFCYFQLTLLFQSPSCLALCVFHFPACKSLLFALSLWN